MKIVSILENQKIEKRIAISPEIAKKYISLGLEVVLSENYGSHLGIKDEEYKVLGVSISKDEKEIISNADIIVQLGLLSDDKSSFLDFIHACSKSLKLFGVARSGKDPWLILTCRLTMSAIFIS